MPLSKGNSEQTQDANRRELWAAYRRHGRIGASRPLNKSHAGRMIEAIVAQKARGDK